MSEAEKRRNKEHKEINSEVKEEPKVTNTMILITNLIRLVLSWPPS